MVLPTVAPGQVMLIGEAPNAQEHLAGVPFIGQSGQLLREVLTEAGIDPTLQHYTNACLCRPPKNDTPVDASINACRPRLLGEIDQFKPSFIVCLGATALKSLFPKAGKVTSLRGQVLEYQGIPVLVTWHPSYILRNPGQLETFLLDIQKINQAPPYKEPTFRIVDRLPDIPDGTIVYIDFETTAKDPWKGEIYLTGIQLDTSDEVLIYHGPKPNLNPKARYVAHNAQFEYAWFKYHLGIAPIIHADTMLMHYCTKETPPHDLKSLAQDYLNVKEDWSIDVTRLRAYPVREVAKYLAWDVDTTRALYRRFKDHPVVEEVHYPLLMDALPMCAEIYLKGFPVDEVYLQNLCWELEDGANQKKLEFQGLCPGVLPSSPQQVSKHLYEALSLPDNFEGSTNEEALKSIAHLHEAPSKLLEIRGLEKLRSTYAVGLLNASSWDGCVHTRLLQHVAETGRLSSRDPNLQNIPRGPLVRKAFVAPPGKWLVEMDYSQLEFRIACHVCQDPNMIQYIRDGRDVHREMAAAINGIPPEEVSDEQRFQAKNGLVFAALFRKKVENIAREWNIPLEEARRWFKILFGTFPKLEPTLIKVGEDALKDGYVRHSNGRIRRFPVITNQNKNEVIRKAVNSPIQGLASDICLTSAVRIHNLFPRIDVRLLIHDAILVFVDKGDIEAIHMMRDIMMSPIYPISVPLEVDIKVSTRWYGEAIKV